MCAAALMNRRMAHRFSARAVASEIDVDGDMQAGVAEYEDEEGFFLHFTCPVSDPSAHDIALGFDTYCVTTPDQCTSYGCVREVTRTAGSRCRSTPLVWMPWRRRMLRSRQCSMWLVKVLTVGRRKARP